MSNSPRDSLVAWLRDTVWLTEELRADLWCAEALSAAQVDSLTRRAELAELRLGWERERPYGAVER